MKTLVRILIVDDDRMFVKRLRDLIAHPQIIVDNNIAVAKDLFYDFCVIGSSAKTTEALDTIRTYSAGSSIYLSGPACNQSVPIRKMIKCNIIDCLENDENIRNFIKNVNSLVKQKAKLHKASCKLDCLQAGDLDALTQHLKKTESDKFVDYIQNHPLPMVLVDREGEVMHANSSMEDMIGTKLSGIMASVFWEDAEAFDNTVYDLKEKGQLLGREVTLKNIHGKLLKLKLYTSLHYDKHDEWLNTRCLFVPIDPPE